MASRDLTSALGLLLTRLSDPIIVDTLLFDPAAFVARLSDPSFIQALFHDPKALVAHSSKVCASNSILVDCPTAPSVHSTFSPATGNVLSNFLMPGGVSNSLTGEGPSFTVVFSGSNLLPPIAPGSNLESEFADAGTRNSTTAPSSALIGDMRHQASIGVSNTGQFSGPGVLNSGKVPVVSPTGFPKAAISGSKHGSLGALAGIASNMETVGTGMQQPASHNADLVLQQAATLSRLGDDDNRVDATADAHGLNGRVMQNNLMKNINLAAPFDNASNLKVKSFFNAVNPMTSTVKLQSVRKGEYLSVNIDDSIHRQGVRDMQNSIIGRMLLKFGAKPMPITELKESLNTVWNIQGNWKLASLGKGYFNIQMEDLRERDRILLRRLWTMEFGHCKLQKWVPEFNPYKVSSHTRREYFYVPIIEQIASALGPVVSIDAHTRNRTMCHYARVLIELDLRKNKEYKIMYERSGHCSIASVGYEQHPEFCVHCQIVGHSLDNCRSFGDSDGKKDDRDKPPPRDGPGKGAMQKTWVRKEQTGAHAGKERTETCTTGTVHDAELWDRGGQAPFI